MTFLSVVLAIIIISGLIAYLRSAQPRDSQAFDQPKDRTSVPTLDQEFVASHWREIGQMMSAGGAGLKSSLIEADKLLDYVMQAKGFKGEDMGSRLKSNGSKFSDLNGVWSAHKLRNQYAHEVAIDVVPSQVHAAVEKLGQGLRDLGVKL